MRAQSAVEYALVVSLALLILIPLWLNISNTLAVTRIGLQSSYTKHAVSKLAAAADAVVLVANAITAKWLAPNAEPALKPNQPNHNKPVPINT